MTTDKRAAAIAALQKAREALSRVCREQGGKLTMCVPARPDQDDDLVIGDALHKALAALEADDGRALLRQLRAEFSGLPSGGPRCMVHRDHLLSRIDRLLASPEQPAPEPAAPHADDEAPRNLYHVQDPERGMHVLATSFQDAVDRWRARIAFENAMEPSEVDDPDGVALVAKGHKEFPEVLA